MTLTVEQLTKPLKLARRVQETGDAISLVFEIPHSLKNDFAYQAGQFVTLFLTINGETISRSYSLCTSPLTDEDFKITVKKVPGGRGSTFLCEQVKEGDELRVTPPSGHFFKPSLTPLHYVLFAGGSGITPIFSILKTVLSANPENKVSLIYANRKEDAIIYSTELMEWEGKNPSRLKTYHILSQPSPEWGGHRGRCNEEWVKNFYAECDRFLPMEFYVCGPEGFMATVRSSLLACGVAKEAIREESFGGNVHQKPAASLNDSWTYIGHKSEADAQVEKIIVTLDGETVECKAVEKQSILETLMEAGLNPPYSCMDGACMSCMAKVEKGLVYQEDPGILADDNIENHETLTCQAKPASRIVHVNYDDI